MNLYEFEGKQLFKKYKIPVPKGVLIKPEEAGTASFASFPVVVKAQVQSGKRGKGGGILFAADEKELRAHVGNLFATKVCNDEVLYILAEEKQNIAHEFYLAVTYNTQKKVPVVLFSASGGMEIEQDADTVAHCLIDPLAGFEEFRVREMLVRAGVKGKDIVMIADLAKRLYRVFEGEDARLAEINPLVKTAEGGFVALDAKVILDDDASFRHDWSQLPERTTLGRRITERERAARTIDQGEFYYRGTAGKYIEMEGDIACLFSGGGASISMMDALEKAGGKPSNYTEYSGNPPREKVHQLAKVVLSKPGLRGIWIVGGVANFTHIGETMAGIADALAELQPRIPIVIRRAGPHEEEGRRLMEEVARKYNLDLTWYGREMSMSETARILMDKLK